MSAARNIFPTPDMIVESAPDSATRAAKSRAEEERRAETRADCDYPARIVSCDRTLSLMGRIVNISAAGAKIAVRFPEGAPSDLFLFDLAHGHVYACETRWRSWDAIGVQFRRLLTRDELGM